MELLTRLARRATIVVGMAMTIVPATLIAQRSAHDSAEAWIRARYSKAEYRIPMRDGVQLYTVVYSPRDTSRDYPFLMHRTPYGSGPYGPAEYRVPLHRNLNFQRDGFIFVFQDVRGRNRSEGAFTLMAPHIENKRPGDVDESTDTYDTLDWLVKHVAHNNGRAGMLGGSFPGFYTLASCINPHPALVACSPQAIMADVWMGDDFFHNGALTLPHTTMYLTAFGRLPRSATGEDRLEQEWVRNIFNRDGGDAYQFFLDAGPVGPFWRREIADGTSTERDSMLAHPSYDAYWQARNLLPHLKNMRAAMLIVGGLFDAEDLYGPPNVYKTIERLNPTNKSTLVEGPWAHAGWGHGPGNGVGHFRWTTETWPFFLDSVEFAFMKYHLKGGPNPNLPEALVFRTGADHWDRLDAWPPRNLKRRSLYLQPGGRLLFDAAPTEQGNAAGLAYDQYVSDPAKPVPAVDRLEGFGMPADYMTADQRFASRRPDVLTYQTEPLTEDVTLAGPVWPHLFVSTTGTDADFVVKLIDVYPSDAPNWPNDKSGFVVAGYQQLVRGNPFRGRYRRSFAHPIPFVPNTTDSIRFELADINHTFRKGHRIMVQIQSTWFPTYDRNPQTFVPDILEAKPEDFRTATMRVFHSARFPTRLDVGVVP